MKNGRLRQYEIRRAAHYGEIGAGRVVPFMPRNELVSIIVPAGYPADEHLAVLTVRGVSLENEGIYDGDLLILRRKFSLREITPQTICAVYMHSTGELVAKKVIKGATMLTLRASGGGIKDICVSPDEIEIRGIVFAFQRMHDNFSKFRPPIAKEDLPF